MAPSVNHTVYLGVPLNRLRLAGAGSAAAVAAALLVSPAAHAAPPLGITDVKLATFAHGSQTKLVVRAVCPNDPPDTLFITGDPGDGGGDRLLGSGSITCDRTRQKFVLLLSTPLSNHSVVSHVFVSISGDGGEVDFRTDSLVVQ